jgi:hypothetical protein
MYHGIGGGMDIKQGPASWFIVSKKDSYIITRWKAKCDEYWKINDSTDNYFWMDGLFKELYETDVRFNKEWNNVPYISCEDDGSSHTLAKYGVFSNIDFIKTIFKENPPYVLKFWNHSNERLRSCDTECTESIGVYAMEMSKRNTNVK